MGTSYYLEFNKCECCERYEKLHIGKFSAGWKFALRVQEGYWKDYSEFIQYSQRIECRIYDEYGESISEEDFLDKVDRFSDSKTHSENDSPLKVKSDSEVDLVYYEFS